MSAACNPYTDASKIQWGSMRCVGFRLDSGQCRVAILSKSKAGFRIHELRSFPTIKDFLQKNYRFRHVCALEEKDVLIKRIHVPSTRFRILKKILPFQIDTQFALPQKDFLFHPFTCFTNTFFVAAAAKKSVDAIIRAFNPEVITTEQSALLHFAKTFAEEYHSLCLVFVKKEEVLCLTLEKGNYTKSLTFKMRNVSESIDSILSLMPANRKLPLLFLGNERVRLSLKEEFSRRLENAPLVSLSLTDAQIEYALEIGMALEGIETASMSIQFRKGKKVHTLLKSWYRRSVAAAVLSLVVLSLSLHSTFSRLYEKNAARLHDVVNELTETYTDLYTLGEHHTNIHTQIAAMEKTHARIPTTKRFMNNGPNFSKIYSEVSSLLERHTLRLDSFTYHLDSYPTVKNSKSRYSGEVRLSIKGDDPVTIKEFCEDLSQQPHFLEGKNITVKRESHGFTITGSFSE